MDREVANAIRILAEALRGAGKLIGDGLKIRAAVFAVDKNIEAKKVREWLKEFDRRDR